MRGVVHRRRDGVADRVGDDAVERGVGADLAEPELLAQLRDRHLAGRHAVAGVGPGRPESLRQQPRDQARRAHRQHDLALWRVGRSASSGTQSASAVAVTASFTTAAPVAAIAR